jgi:lysophospholipase L1-like esterase
VRLGPSFRFIAYGTLAFATLELAARIDDFVKDGASLLEPYTINTLFRPSPFGREGVPSARFGKWQMNSLGYRSPEMREGRSNVLTFGASETFGLYESANHEYPRMLAERLDEFRPQAFNVVNIAIPGMRIGRVGYLERAIDQTKASHVVVYPSPANYIGTTKPFCQQASTPVPSSSGLGEQVRLAGKLDQLAKKFTPSALQTAIRSLSIWWATRHEVLQRRVPEETLAALREDLACVVRAAQRRGSTPILVTHATYFGDRLEAADEAMLLAWRRFYPELLEEGFLDLERRANDVIRSVAAQYEVPLVDAAAAIPRGPAYFADFVHFTDKGARVIGQLVAAVIATCQPVTTATNTCAPTPGAASCGGSATDSVAITLARPG